MIWEDMCEIHWDFETGDDNEDKDEYN
jgi:hypothetical protein